jgi:hypothetical protein
LSHVAIIGVAAHGIESKISARFDRPLRIGTERFGYQLIALVESSSNPVRCANKGAMATADDTQT